MQTLVEDLLTYSRAGVGEQTWMMVDLNQTLERVQSDLQGASRAIQSRNSCR